MIPNIEQLLLVCGISFAGVGIIICLLLKMPIDPKDGNNSDDSGE